jgi:chromosomal replication initiation ATPase DnaA
VSAALYIVWDDDTPTPPLVDLPQPVDAVVREVAKSTGVSSDAIRGRARYRHVVAARHQVWGRLHRYGWSAAGIAREFMVDHTTVLAALAKPWRRVR